MNIKPIEFEHKTPIIYPNYKKEEDPMQSFVLLRYEDLGILVESKFSEGEEEEARKFYKFHPHPVELLRDAVEIIDLSGDSCYARNPCGIFDYCGAFEKFDISKAVPNNHPLDYIIP